MNPPNPESLLARARIGDLDALAAIYDAYSPGLYRYAARLLGRAATAEDCVAETFARFLAALRAGQGPHDHLQAYLYRVAHNWASDAYRRQPPPASALDEHSLADGHPPPEAQTVENLQQERVRRALAALTPDQRQVIALRYLEEWDLEHVAAALRKPVGAVKALQHRALATLRRLLAEGNRV